MEKLVDFIKKSWRQILFIIGIICVVIPIIVHFCALKVDSSLSSDGIVAYIIGAMSACATLLVAMVSIWQTQKSNETSSIALGMQKEEYIPVFTVESFTGKSTESLRMETYSSNNEAVVQVCTLDNNETVAGYGFSAYVDNFDKNKDTEYRAYQVKLKYHGKAVIERMTVDSMEFTKPNKKFDFNHSNLIDVSFTDGQEIILFFYVIGNNSFNDKRYKEFEYTASRKLKLNLKMTTLAGANYTEELIITKYLVETENTKLNEHFDEMMVSYSHKVHEETLNTSISKEELAKSDVVKKLLSIHKVCERSGNGLYLELKNELEKLIDGDKEKIQICRVSASKYDYLSMNLSTVAILLAFTSLIVGNDDVKNLVYNSNTKISFTFSVGIIVVPIIISIVAIRQHNRENKLKFIMNVLDDIEADMNVN